MFLSGTTRRGIQKILKVPPLDVLYNLRIYAVHSCKALFHFRPDDLSLNISAVLTVLILLSFSLIIVMKSTPTPPNLYVQISFHGVREFFKRTTSSLLLISSINLPISCKVKSPFYCSSYSVSFLVASCCCCLLLSQYHNSFVPM